MILPFLLCLAAWSGIVIIMAYHIWIAPRAYEDEEGFHPTPRNHEPRR